jgi:hypothetical protein
MLVENLILRANNQLFLAQKTQTRVILTYENQEYLEQQLVKSII